MNKNKKFPDIWSKENNPFEIGDYVKVNEFFQKFSWYSNETFQIVNIDDDMVYLNKSLSDDLSTSIHYSRLYIDIPYIRKLKIKKIKQRLCSK